MTRYRILADLTITAPETITLYVSELLRLRRINGVGGDDRYETGV